MEEEYTDHERRLFAITHADAWYFTLSKQQKAFVEEIAAKVMSQGIVMRVLDGDTRRGLDMFPDAFQTVVKHPPADFDIPKMREFFLKHEN